MSKVVLALVPHPDDAEFYAGGLLAKLAAEGARVHIVVATDGRRGSFEADSETLIAAARRGDAPRRCRFWVLSRRSCSVTPTGSWTRCLPASCASSSSGPFGSSDRTWSSPRIRTRRLSRTRIIASWRGLPPRRSTSARLPLFHPEHLAEGLAPHLVVEKYFYANVPTLTNQCIDISEHLSRKVAALAEHRSQMTFLVAGVLFEAEAAGLNPRAMFGD